MKQQSDIIRAELIEKTDRELDAKIKDAILKLDQILAKTMSSVRAESKCNEQFST